MFLLFQGCDDHLSCKHHDVFDCWSRYGILILFQDECQATVLSRRLFIELQFAILGTIAHSTNTSIDSVVNSGPGLVFITYPEVVLRLPGAPVWAVLFFIMLAVSLLYHTWTRWITFNCLLLTFRQILGIDSEFCNVESFVTGVIDNWPEKLRKNRKMFTFLCVLAMFCLDIPMVTKVRRNIQIVLLTVQFAALTGDWNFH